MQCVWCHARSGRQCGPQHAVRGEVAPVRERKRVIVFSCAAEPDIPSMRGKDQRAENGGVSTGLEELRGRLDNLKRIDPEDR